MYKYQEVTDLYIGIHLTKDNMGYAVIGRNEGKFSLMKLWIENKVSYKRLFNEIRTFIDSLCEKFYSYSEKELKLQNIKNKIVMGKFDEIKEYLDIHYFGLNAFKLIFEKESFINRYNNASITHNFHELVGETETNLALISSAFNEKEINLFRDIDLSQIIEELDKCVVEDNKTDNPIAATLNVSLGEILYRSLTNRLPYFVDFGSANEGLYRAFSSFHGGTQYL